MTLTPVESLPKKENRGFRHDLQTLVKEFMNGDARIAKIDGYVFTYSLYNGLRAAVQRSGYPVRVHMRGNDVYLVKKI